MGREATAQEVADLLKASDRILIVSHQRPDGDCLGSATALLAGLKAIGKTAAAYNPSGVPRILKFLPLANEVSTSLPAWEPSVTVFVDCGGVDRVADGFQPRGTVINVDHHATNSRFGDLNYIDMAASAVGEQMRTLLALLGVALTPETATSIYTSLMTDTGCFRYANTKARAFELAAELAKAGAKPGPIAQEVYESKTPGEVMLTARCLSSLHLECEGRLAWAQLMLRDYADIGDGANEPEGLSSELRAIEGVELSILFHEIEGGGMRASLRGKGKVDCAKLAENFGGGGHAAAAGITQKGVEFEKARDAVLEKAREATRLKTED